MPRKRYRDLVDYVGGDRTSGGRSSPYRSTGEVINAPDGSGSARRGLVPRKSFFTTPYAWECPECGTDLKAHWARCPECKEPRPYK